MLSIDPKIELPSQENVFVYQWKAFHWIAAFTKNQGQMLFAQGIRILHRIQVLAATKKFHT